MGLFLEGFGGEFEIGKIAFDWKIFFKKKKEEKKKGKRRVFLWETNLGLEG